MINVLVIDDHPIVRRGLKQILQDIGDIAVTGEASTGPEALQKVMEQDFDIALLDISMPGRSGVEVLRDFKNLKPDMQVLILSTYPESQYALRALKSQAAGYVSKASANEELITAIRKVAQGGKYVSATLAEKLAFEVAGDPSKLPHETLSDREYQVLCLIAAGKTVTEIGKELALSLKTVSTYRARILEKMNLKNNAEIVRYALQQRLVD